MSLATQNTYLRDPVLLDRMNAAIFRHAVYLITKASPTTNEVTWRDAIMGMRYTDASLLGRCYTYLCAQPTVYNATSSAEAAVTDTILLALVPNLPDAIKP